MQFRTYPQATRTSRRSRESSRRSPAWSEQRLTIGVIALCLASRHGTHLYCARSVQTDQPGDVVRHLRGIMRPQPLRHDKHINRAQRFQAGSCGIRHLGVLALLLLQAVFLVALPVTFTQAGTCICNPSSRATRHSSASELLGNTVKLSFNQV